MAVYAERRDWDADEGYVITERYGRSYYKGRAFATHDDAMAAAKSIGETERPYGVWVVPADDDARSREVLVYEETASPEELAASDAKDVALLHGAELAFGNYKDYVGSADQEEDLPKLAEAMHAQLPCKAGTAIYRRDSFAGQCRLCKRDESCAAHIWGVHTSVWPHSRSAI